MSLRVAVVGMGQLGKALCEATERSPHASLNAVQSRRGRAAARDFAHVDVETDAAALFARGDVDVLLLAGTGTAQKLAEDFRAAATAGLSAVTSSALWSPASEIGAGPARDLDDLARRRRVHLLGTGVNPGLLLDALPALCASLNPGWSKVSATRSVDASSWGLGILEELGIGATRQAFDKAETISLRPSLAVIYDALGIDLAEVSETRTPAFAEADSDHAAPVVGFDQRVSGLSADGRRVDLCWSVQTLPPSRLLDFRPGLEITVDTSPEPFVLSMGGGFASAPYAATAERMLASALAMRRLPHGLLTVADIPWFPTSSERG